jgi:pimeloyl-ACP methyl ester carboxylesterase
MGMRTTTVLVMAVAAVMAAAPAGAGHAAAGTVPPGVSPVDLTVSLSADGAASGPLYHVRGASYTGPAPSTTAVLLLHGLSYGSWVWDFPIGGTPADPYRYSTARDLAAHGYDVVAVDELGYGRSDHPTGADARQLTIPAYASMAHQIVQALRATHRRVVIAGHSAGGEIANYEAGRYRDVDGLVDMAMCDAGASPEVIGDIAVNDTAGAGQDYGYFGGDRAERTRLMYALTDADPAIVERDTTMANLTPTAEMQSISPQPARTLDALVTAPVLVAFGQNDAIFPPPCQQLQAPLYRQSPAVTVATLPAAGHSLMLHLDAPVLHEALLAWLRRVAPA